MLLAAFGRWEQYGTLDPRPGDPADERLDQWLEDMRLGTRRHLAPVLAAGSPGRAGPGLGRPRRPAGPAAHRPVPGQRNWQLLRRSGGAGRRCAGRESRRLRKLYGGLRDALGITPLNVAADGNCFYASLLVMFEPRLREFFARVPTIEEMRNDLADGCRLTSTPRTPGMRRRTRSCSLARRPGRLIAGSRRRPLSSADIRPNPDPQGPPPWENDAGDWVAQVAADVWGLPITLLGQQYPVDLGPQGPDRARDVRYVMLHGRPLPGRRNGDQVSVGAGAAGVGAAAGEAGCRRRRRRPMRADAGPASWRCTRPRSGTWGRGSPS